LAIQAIEAAVDAAGDMVVRELTPALLAERRSTSPTGRERP
jgi:hypothetical protein